MLLDGVLIGKFTDEEFLVHQRKLNKERCEKVIAKIKKDINNSELVKAKEKDAAFAMQNKFDIPGSCGEKIYVGTPPKWSEMHTNDEEGLWVLNRTHHFNELAQLYHLTGKSEYAKKVLSDMENWIDTCPLPTLPTDSSTSEELLEIRKVFSGLNPWRSLEVGIRMFDSWNYAYDCLLYNEFMTPQLHSKIARSFYEHALVLREMSPRYWPNANHNHYIHEMLGLLLVACVFPDFKESNAWREFAIHELKRCAKAQFTEDGAQVEGSPNYHNGCLSMFFSFVEVARIFGFELPDEIFNICRKATDYLLASICPDGIITPIGDTGYNKVAENIIRRYYTCFGELGPCAKLFAIHHNLDPDIVPEEVQAAARKYAFSAPGEDNRQRQIDQYFARTGWTDKAAHFSFLCHSPVFNGHSHIDPMSITLHLKGDPVIVDPSYFTYRECEERKLFKSPEYHSCLTFDNKHPYEYTGRWSFGPQKEGKIRNFYSFGNVFAADASHHGYDPDYHKRLCALIGDDIFIVADDVINITKTDVRIYFHMDDPEVKAQGSVASSERIRVLLPEGVSAEIEPARKALCSDITLPTSRIILTDKSHQSRQYLTIFTKRDDISSPKIERTSEGLKISYKQADEEKAYLWSFTQSLKKV